MYCILHTGIIALSVSNTLPNSWERSRVCRKEIDNSVILRGGKQASQSIITTGK